MKRILLPALVVLAAFALARGAAADTPFPAVHSGDVFVIAQTVTTDGSMHDYYKPGDTVVFRAYAVDGKNHKILTEAKYFYATIPGQPNVKFKYDPKAKTALGQYAWIGTWTVPSTYQLGLVNFKVLVQAKTKRRGSFVQMPVPTSQLTITNTPPPTGTTPPGASSTPTGTDNTVVYADSVNGTRPAGAAPRPIGCTQTNVFKRGEQFVLRTWGFDLTTKTVFSLDNVTEAHFTVPGLPNNVVLNWGSHGAAKVFFWSNFWNIPTAYPLGDVTVKITYTLTTGKAATLDYPITIIP